MPPKNTTKKKSTPKKSPMRSTRSRSAAAAVKRRASGSDAEVVPDPRLSKKMKPTVSENDPCTPSQPAEPEEISQNSTVYAPLNEGTGSAKSSLKMPTTVPGQSNRRTDKIVKSNTEEVRTSTVEMQVDNGEPEKAVRQTPAGGFRESTTGDDGPEKSGSSSDEAPFDVKEVDIETFRSKLKERGKDVNRPGETSTSSPSQRYESANNTVRNAIPTVPNVDRTTGTTDRGNSLKKTTGPLHQSLDENPESERCEKDDGPVSMSQPSVGSEKRCGVDSDTSVLSKGTDTAGKKGMRGKNSVEAKYKSIMEKECSRIKEIFYRKSVSTAIASAMVDVMYTEICSKATITSADLVMIMNLLMFGKQKKSKKSECFTTPVGLLASLFRKKCIKNSVLHVTRGLVPDSNMKVKMEDLKNRPELGWLRKVIPSPTICDVVSEMNEKKGCGASSKPTHNTIGQGTCQPGKADISEFALANVYGVVVRALHVNRKAAKKMFFSRIGYLLTDWKSVRFTDVEQDAVAMWVKPMKENEYLRPSDVPETRVATSPDQAADADVENLKLFNDFLKERQELVIIVEHSVKVKTVKEKETPSTSSNTAFLGNASYEMKTRPFRRSFSLAGIALSVFSDLCAVTSNDSTKTQVLKFHRRSLAVCYVMAIGFKEMIKSCEDVIKFGVPVDETAEMDAGLGSPVENLGENSNTGYSLEPNRTCVIRDMMAIGETESRHELERNVGTVKEKFWKDNHIGDSEEDGAAGLVGQENNNPPEVDDLEDLDPESIELDM